MMQVFIETTDKDNSRWIDARFDLQNAAAGRRMYEEEHVEGALHWDLEKDLSDMASGEGRHPMPSRQAITELIQRSGLALTDRVVIYDQGGEPYAARAWWLLKYAGFTDVFISSLGFADLKAQGIATSAEIPAFEPAGTEPEFVDSLYADQTYVRKIVSGEEFGVLLDARSPERFKGLHEPIDKVAGRIPGARNFDWTQSVENGRFINDADLSAVVSPKEPAVVYCGSGVTAAALFAVLAQSGHEHVRLYTGSFSDWIASEDNVVEFDRPDNPGTAGEREKAILARLIQEGYSGEMLMKKFEYEKSQLQDKQPEN